MKKVIVLQQITGCFVFDKPDGMTAEEVAASAGVTDPARYQEFESTDFDPGCYDWLSCFTLVSGVVGFDFAAAKLSADDLVKQQSRATQQTLLDGYTAEQIAAQAALAALSRDVRFQTIINDLNVESADTLQKQTDIAAATTIAEVNAIVYP
jgi:hypothetical protein